MKLRNVIGSVMRHKDRNGTRPQMPGQVVTIAIQTTGDDPYVQEILEIAAVILQDGVEKGRFCELIKPQGPMPPQVIKSTGIAPGMVKDARDRDAVIGDFMDFLPADALCLAHGPLAPKFLKRATADRLRNAALDASELARICLPALPNHDLDSVCSGFKMPDSTKHGAIAEAEKLSRIWEKMIETVSQMPIPILRAICELFSPYRRYPLKDVFAAVLANNHKKSGAEENLVELFRKENVARVKRAEPPTEYEKLDLDGLAGIFGSCGPFAEKVDTYELRKEQLTMVQNVGEALNNSKHLFIEAGTGTGKSLAYLVPAVFWATKNKVPVVISTNTKNLQHQLFEKDIPLLRQVLGHDFKAALIKGRRNYLCIRKLLYLLKYAPMELEKDDRVDMAAALVWAVSTETGDISDCGALEAKGSRGLGSQLSLDSEECLGLDCPLRQRCLLVRARQKSLLADVVIANHSVVFAEMGLDPSPALPKYKHIIFDEAHNLEAAATSHLSVEISYSRITFILGRLFRTGRGRSGHGLLPVILGSSHAKQNEKITSLASAGIEAIASIEPTVPQFFETLQTVLGNDQRQESKRIILERRDQTQWTQITNAKIRLISGLAGVTKAIEGLLEAVRDMQSAGNPELVEFITNLEGVIAWLKELSEDIDFFMMANDPNYVYWVERASPMQGGAKGWAAPIHIGRMLAEQLYGQKDSIVFTSATLSVKGKDDFLKKRLGINLVDPQRLLTANLGTPFDYPNQCLVLVPTFLPEPSENDTGYSRDLGILLAEVFRRTQGRAMTLFTSYRMLDQTTETVRQELPGDGIQVLAQGESGSRESITAAFRAGNSTVLMGTHSFWEGVDIVGDALSCLVVARLPFAVFTEPIVEARCEQVQAAGEDSFLGYSVPNAVIRFRQGFGRLIRHRNDRGVVIIADRRIVTKRYGEWFQASIPTRTVAVSNREVFLEAVERFLEGEC